MHGIDKSGDDLRGNNDAFSVKASLGKAEATVDSCVSMAFNKYKELVASDVVALGKPSEDNTEKLIASHKRFKQGKKHG